MRCASVHAAAANQQIRSGTAIAFFNACFLRRIPTGLASLFQEGGATFFAFVNFCRTSPKTLVWQGFTRRHSQNSLNCVNKCRTLWHRHSKPRRPNPNKIKSPASLCT